MSRSLVLDPKALSGGADIPVFARVTGVTQKGSLRNNDSIESMTSLSPYAPVYEERNW